MTTLRRPTFVYFDLGKVLLNFDHARSARQIAKITGSSEATIYERLFAGSFQNDYETGSVSSQEFCNRIRELTGSKADNHSLMHAASDIFWLNNPIIPLIVQLAAIGMPMGILSNTCEAHWQFVKANRFKLLDQFFSINVLSYESRSMKPDAKIYSDAAAAAGVAASEIFFMDDRQENVDGAIAAGLDAVLFTTASKLALDLAARGVEFNY